MRDYSLSALIAFFVGWLAQTIMYGLFLRFTSGEFSIASNLLSGAVIFWIFSLATNVIFIQLPGSYIKRIIFKTNAVLFAFLSAAYGTIIFGLTLGLLANSSFIKSLPFYTGAMINGFAFGLALHLIWQPVEIDE